MIAWTAPPLPQPQPPQEPPRTTNPANTPAHSAPNVWRANQPHQDRSCWRRCSGEIVFAHLLHDQRVPERIRPDRTSEFPLLLTRYYASGFHLDGSMLATLFFPSTLVLWPCISPSKPVLLPPKLYTGVRQLRRRRGGWWRTARDRPVGHCRPRGLRPSATALLPRDGRVSALLLSR